MTKKFVFTVIVLLCLIVAIGAYVYAVWLETYRQEQDFNIDSEYYNESEKYFEYKLVYSDDTHTSFAAVVVDYTGLVTTAHIPNDVFASKVKYFDSNIPIEERPNDDYILTVIGIETRAFMDNDVIKKIIIPYALKFIEDNSFNNCENLTELSFILKCDENGYVEEPHDELTINEYAFISCEKLSKIKFVQNNDDFTEIIAIDAMLDLPDVNSILMRFPTTDDYLKHPIAENSFYGTPIFEKINEFRNFICPKPQPDPIEP